MEDLIEKRCGEIFLTIYGTTIFFCSLCEKKYECYEDYAEHLNNQHIIVEIETKQNDIKTETLDELEAEGLEDDEDSIRLTHFVKCGDLNNDLKNENRNEFEDMDIRKCIQSIESIDYTLNYSKPEAKYIDDDSSSEAVSMQDEEEYIKRPVTPTYVPSKLDKNKFQCPYCEHATADKSNLRRHIERHLNYKPHKCTECSKAFGTRSELNTHILTHTGERPFVCEICGFGLTTSSARIKHIKRRHKNHTLNIEKDNKGDVKNNKILKKYHGYSKAIKIFTKKKDDNIMPLKNNEQKILKNKEDCILQVRTIKLRKTSKERNYKCPHCFYACVDKSNLISHIKRHFNNKSYECTQCDKKFHTRNELNTHIRTHTGELPFLCTQCGMAFKTSCKLKNHFKRHEENQDKICSICYKQFFDAESLRGHMSLHIEEMDTSIC